MRTHLHISERLLPRIDRAINSSLLSQGPLAWCIIVLVMALFLIPYAFTDIISKALGAYASLSTISIAVAVLSMLSIAVAVLSMLPIAVAVLLRAFKGAIVVSLLFVLSTAFYHVVVYGLAWPPRTVMGWLLATSGLMIYALIAGHMRTISNQLGQAHVTIQKQALTDMLTGLPNHRAIIEHMQNELARAQRFERPFSLIFFDGDRFKGVNDTYGHGIGDVVLRELGERVGNVLRGGDTLGRFGGEEFVILLPEADLEQACQIAERIRAAVAAAPLATTGYPNQASRTSSDALVELQRCAGTQFDPEWCELQLLSLLARKSKSRVRYARWLALWIREQHEYFSRTRFCIFCLR